MNSDTTKIYNDAARYLRQGESVVLATVTEGEGSSPRGVGAKMLVCENGRALGSVGGGVLEESVLRLCKEAFLEKRSFTAAFSLSKEDIAGTGMACGGRVTVFVQYVSCEDTETPKLFESASPVGDRQSWLVTLIPDGRSSYSIYFYAADEEIPAGLARDISLLKEHFGRASRCARIEDRTYLIEPLARCKAFVFGGGHIGCALVPLLFALGFYTVIIDDREEFCGRLRFPQADERVVGGYDDVSSLGIGENGYVVIITRGHLHDKEVLAGALNTKAAYIGMIGSKTKREAIYSSLLEEGFTQNDLDRVYSPIGLAIGAQTPEEIAVSIAAEMILKRANADAC
jgi:xanthine dehydrogenase accessory factor